MSETLTVQITGRDGVSKVFTAISNSATKTGDAVERAGKEGAQGLKQLDAQAKTTGQSMDQLKNRATAVGAAVGVLLSATSLLGASYRDQQRQIDGITRTYGNQAEMILEITERIQEQTKFSDDAAREAALFATALVDAYGLSADQIGILIERSADLAQIYGVSLPDAMLRTAGAIRGEGEAAERLGLNMSDAAIAARALDAGITNWNVPGALSEAERAAFRFQVFLEDTEQSVGAAADAADTAGGRFRQFLNDVQDVGQRVGGALGPVGEVAAELSPVILALPVVSAGLGRFGTALAGTAVGARAATLGISALGLVVSPLGLGLAAVAVAGVGVYKIFQNIQDSASGVAEGVGLLTAEIERLKLAAEPEAAAQVQTMLETIQKQIDLLGGSDMREITENLGLPPGTDYLQITTPGGLADQVKTAGQLMDEFSEHVIATANSLTDPAAKQAYLDWINGLLSDIQYTVEGTNLDDIINEVLTTPASEVPGVMNAIEDSTTGATAALTDYSAITAASANSTWDYIDSVNGATTANTNMMESIAAVKDAQQEWLGQGDNILDFWLQYQHNLRDAANEYGRLKAEALESGEILPQFDYSEIADSAFVALVKLADEADDTAEALDAVLRTFQQIDELGQRSAQAESIATALIGAPGELGALQDLWTRINEGTADAALTADQYNEAIAAGIAIQESNLRIQDDLTAMRAQQLPLLAQEQAAYEAMIDEISQLPALEQRRALALMDSNVQAQIASQYATAYSASLGEIPEEVATNMIVSAAEADPVLKDLLLQFGLIEEGADGTITVNFPDGPTVQESIQELTASIDALTIAMGGVPPLHIEADTEDAITKVDAARDHIQRLDGETATTTVEGDNTDSLRKGFEALAALQDVDGESATTYEYGVNADALSKISQVRGALGALDGASATVSVLLNDRASGGIGRIGGALAGLDGRSATVTTNYVTRYSSTGTPGPTRSMFGGVVDEYALGGTVPIWTSEAGTEIAHLPTGGMVPLPGEGLRFAPPGTFIEPASAVSARSGLGSGLGSGITLQLQVDVHGNVYGVDDLVDEIAEPLFRGLSRKIDERNIALGVNR